MAKRKWSNPLLYLGPSKIDGIGCYSDIVIREGEFVRIFSPEDSRWVPLKKAHASPHKKLIKKFGIRVDGGYWAPIDFLRISVGWYMNHSETPNLQSDDGDVTYYALEDIYHDSYNYWNVTLSATLAPFELQLAYLGVDSRADDHFDEDAVGDRVALTALWRFSNQ